MIGRPGSTLWLLGSEMRLGWRDMFGRRGAVRGMIVVGVLLAFVFAGGLSLGWVLRHVEIPVTPLSIIASDAILLLVFTLMLSQTLFAATQALYARGDLDLLFSSPIAPRKVLTVRFSAIALNVFVAVATLVTPLLLPIAVFGHWRWLASLLVLGAVALLASCAGLLLATALFRLIGPRRTRTVAQVLAAIIGAAFFLMTQIRNLLGDRTGSVWLDLVRMAGEPRFRPPPGADWPIRAMLGEPLPLLAIVAFAAGLFLALTHRLGARFAADAAAASGADTGGAVSATTLSTFAAGAFAATFRKEVRLLRRDAALLSQVFLRVLYLVPAALIVLRNAGSHMTYVLPAGAATLAFLAGQVASSLTWITASAEDAPDLLACSPAPIAVLMRAKLAAALAPIAVLLAIPLAALIVIAPPAGLAATAGCVASALASGLINIWRLKPAKRADFRRRRAGSWLAGLAQVLITMLIGAATALAAALQPWALIPAVLAAVALLLLRRSDAQIAEALRTPV